MSSYSLSGDKFIIEDYDKARPFSSFLPGLAGVKGIPVWSFYTNRGQAINSFGIHHKGNAMMEFNSANTAYENTPIKGFRTFIRLNGQYFEPFCTYSHTAARRMEIEKNVVSVSEESHGIRITVTYLILPHEKIGALVRRVTVENLSDRALETEMLDGMPQIITYGVQNGMYKEMSNLYKSWADIRNLDHQAPIYTMRASSDDSAEVTEIEGGYFYCGVSGGRQLPVIYDKKVIFDYDDSMAEPVVFRERGLEAVLEKKQCFANKVPCGFIPVKTKLEPGESLEFAAFAGYTPSAELLNEMVKVFCRPGYVADKLEAARVLVSELTRDVWTKTSEPLFDQYMEQCYMDNFLRGGYPFVFGQGKNKKTVHLFSRKHGDPERDYNFFSIAGEYYSQGNGNYRDVCQNRRNDVFFNPNIEDFNVRTFYSLIQIDGYNPLEIRPSTFVIRREEKEAAISLIRRYVAGDSKPLEAVLETPFTPGRITGVIAAKGLKVQGDEEQLVTELLALADQQIEAKYGEGYWSDHWDYNLDLVMDYLSVYPERKRELLFGDNSYRYYDSVGVVRPRRDTYVLNKGKVRQYGAVELSEEKAERPGFDKDGTNWLKDRQGKIVTTTLFGKMLTLAVNKFALLDSRGLGIEMEGGKPGWNDAMNGLPGLFGSSMPETLELKRLIGFMVSAVKEQSGSQTVELCAELVRFMRAITLVLAEETDEFVRWDKTAGLREEFREETRFQVSGETEKVSFGELERVLESYLAKLEAAVSQAMALGKGIIPTFFTFEGSEYTEVLNEDGSPRISPYGLPSVTVQKFTLKEMPCFLEGPARYLAACGPEDRETAREMCRMIKDTELYDRKLKMYKTSASIEGESMEVGRVRAFTPGWLERESVFLHMEYKYFLGMLKAGLYDEFYRAVSDALIPYQRPEVYGRSILENSSFLASSVNPDPEVHGQGFVGRLSGSTVEMLSMWIGMFVGKGGFQAEEGRLRFRFAPVLAGGMFDENGEAAFTLAGSCRVVYHNPQRKDTFGESGVKPVRMELLAGGEVTGLEGDILEEEWAKSVREGRVERIDVFLD